MTAVQTGRVRALNAAIGVAFGMVFLEINADELAAGPAIALRAAGAIIGVSLLIWAFRLRRRSESDAPVAFDRRYRLVVGVEVLALAAGLVVLSAILHKPWLDVGWVAIVVGIHFFGLAAVWQAASYRLLGGLLALLGVVGIGVGAATGNHADVAVIAGVGSGVVLLAFATVGLTGLTRSELGSRSSPPRPFT